MVKEYLSESSFEKRLINKNSAENLSSVDSPSGKGTRQHTDERLCKARFDDA